MRQVLPGKLNQLLELLLELGFYAVEVQTCCVHICHLDTSWIILRDCIFYVTGSHWKTHSHLGVDARKTFPVCSWSFGALLLSHRWNTLILKLPLAFTREILLHPWVQDQEANVKICCLTFWRPLPKKDREANGWAFLTIAYNSKVMRRLFNSSRICSVSQIREEASHQRRWWERHPVGMWCGGAGSHGPGVKCRRCRQMGARFLHPKLGSGLCNDPRWSLQTCKMKPRCSLMDSWWIPLDLEWFRSAFTPSLLTISHISRSLRSSLKMLRIVAGQPCKGDQAINDDRLCQILSSQFQTTSSWSNSRNDQVWPRIC